SARPDDAGVLARGLADHREDFEKRLKKAELSAVDSRARKDERSTTWWKVGAGMLAITILVMKLNSRGTSDQPVEQPAKRGTAVYGCGSGSHGCRTWGRFSWRALRPCGAFWGGHERRVRSLR